MRKPSKLTSVVAVSLTVAFAASCGGGGGGSAHLALPACTDTDKFGTVSVPLSSIAHVPPIGVMSPIGGSPLPKGHTGYMLNAADVAVVVPGNMVITGVRETTYLTSPTRPGYVDYAVYYKVCNEVGGHFGHLATVASSIMSQLGSGSCSEYSTVDERVRMCNYSTAIRVTEGSALGTAGTPPHSPALDIGMTDTRQAADFVNPSRYGSPAPYICPSEWFTGTAKTDIESKFGNGFASASENPKCGTMNVDQAGTAKGRWTLQSAPANADDATSGDFFVLARNPHLPESELTISTRAMGLNSTTHPTYTLQPSGRLNRDPASITPDGLIYCYDTDLATSTFSYLLQMTSTTVLRAEMKTHPAGGSVCNSAPATWSFSGSAVNLIR